MEFLKLFADMEQLFEPFSAEERGNLLSAMMAYAFRGDEPGFTGNERFLWPVLKRHIDQCGERAETLRENARKGGRPKTNGNQTKPNETKENQTETKENQTEANGTKENLEQEQEQEQEQEHEQEQEQKEDETRAGDAREWKPRDGGKVIGIDGSDLSDAIRANDAADGMIARFNLPRDIPTREKLLEDIAANGETVMREVLEEACASNTRERVTARYWRAILANRGKPKPARASPDGYMTGAGHRDDAFWRGLEVDLDAETSRP